MASTRTLLFGIFVLAGRKLTAPQVVGLAKPLGISPTNVKSHLTRMVAEGALQRSGPSRKAQYWPSSSQAAVLEGITARLLDTPTKPWDRTWLMLTVTMPSNRVQRERLRASLWFDGFRPWTADTFVRPAWPEPWALERARQHLAQAPGLCLRGTLVGFPAVLDLSAAYRLDALDRSARQLARWIHGRRVPRDSAAKAFATRLKVGGMVARLLGHDPRLPPALWDGRTGMRELVRAFRRFDARIAPFAQEYVDQVVAPHGKRFHTFPSSEMKSL